MSGGITAAAAAAVRPNNSAQGRVLKEASPVNKSSNQEQEMSALSYLQRQWSLCSQDKVTNCRTTTTIKGGGISGLSKNEMDVTCPAIK